jgi:hypothetical protein
MNGYGFLPGVAAGGVALIVLVILCCCLQCCCRKCRKKMFEKEVNRFQICIVSVCVCYCV